MSCEQPVERTDLPNSKHVRWETHASPQAGARPQAIINRQLLDTCDMLVAIFWTRLGAGTVEEIQECINSGRRVLLYFSKGLVPLGYDVSDYAKVQEFKASYQGLYFEFDSLDDFRSQLMRHINSAAQAAVSTGPSALEPPTTAESDDANVASPTSRFADSYRAVIRRFEVRWIAERDSNPPTVEGGRRVVQGTIAELSNLVALFEFPGRPDVESQVQNTLVLLTDLQRTQVYMDGGISFRNFWQRGNEVLGQMKKQLEWISGAAKHAG